MNSIILNCFLLIIGSSLVPSVVSNFLPPRCSSGPLNHAEKNFILTIFNDVREMVTIGQLPGFPKSSNMALLEWNMDLELISQKEADSCGIRIQTCPNSQNVPFGFMVGTYKSRCPYAVQSTYALSSVVTSWYEEHRLLNPQNVRNFQSCAAPNFSQMIAGYGYYLGCGRIYDFDGEFYTMNLICAMAMPGNIYGQPIYDIGAPCTHCYPGCKCDSKEYPALCYGSGPIFYLNFGVKI